MKIKKGIACFGQTILYLIAAVSMIFALVAAVLVFADPDFEFVTETGYMQIGAVIEVLRCVCELFIFVIALISVRRGKYDLKRFLLIGVFLYLAEALFHPEIAGSGSISFVFTNAARIIYLLMAVICAVCRSDKKRSKVWIAVMVLLNLLPWWEYSYSLAEHLDGTLYVPNSMTMIGDVGSEAVRFVFFVLIVVCLIIKQISRHPEKEPEA